MTRTQIRKPRAVAVLVASLLLALAFLLMYRLRPGLLGDLTAEDGVIEYLQAAGYLGAAIAFAAAGIRGSASKLWVFPLAVACFLVAGEEVSWGQRIFGLSTPAGLQDINVQGETNLHNIEGVHGIVRAISVLIVLGLFIALPVIVRAWRTGGRLVDRLRFPVPPWVASVLILIGIAFMAGPRLLADEVSFPLDEVGEMYVAAAWLFFALATWATWSTARRPSGASAHALARDS